MYSMQLPATADAHGGAHGGVVVPVVVVDVQPHPPVELVLLEQLISYIFFIFYGASGAGDPTGTELERPQLTVTPFCVTLVTVNVIN